MGDVLLEVAVLEMLTDILLPDLPLTILVAKITNPTARIAEVLWIPGESALPA